MISSEKEYRELRARRNRLRDISIGWSFFQWNRAKREIKLIDSLLSKWELKKKQK